MKNRDYLAELEKLLASGYSKRPKSHQLEFRNCFGAVAGYVDGNIFVSCGRFGVALKLPPKVLGRLLKEAGVTQLKYFRNGHVKKEYAVIPTRILNDAGRFRELLEQSVEYALHKSFFPGKRSAHANDRNGGFVSAGSNLPQSRYPR